MDFEQLAKIENESERVNRTYDIFNEDARLNHSKAARVEFLTTVHFICNARRRIKRPACAKINSKILHNYA